MDYQRFIEELPNQFEDWQQASVKPKSEQFWPIVQHVSAMTTVNIMQLLNFAVSCLEPGEVYCEIGSYHGATLIGALLNNPHCLAYAVDNFSEFDPTGQNEAILQAHLARFNLQDQVMFCNQDFEEFFFDLANLGSEDKIGVYLYDGAHDYRSNLMGLLMARPFLADRALIVIDDSNWQFVKQANWDFIATNPACQFLLDLPTPIKCDLSFWNGIHLLSWDTSRAPDYDWETIAANRQKPVLRSIYNLQFLEHQAKDREGIYQEALTLHRQQQYALAEKQYQQFLLWQHEHPEAWMNLGRLYLDMQQYPQALEALNTALELDPSLAQVHYLIGRILHLGQVPDQAILAYEQAIALDPDLNDAYRQLAELLFRSQNFARAATVYQALLEKQGLEPYTYLNFSESLRATAQPDAAIAVLREGLLHYPTEGRLHFTLIMLLRQYGQPQAAIEAAKAASVALPNDYTFDLLKHLLLPLTYQTAADITATRQRFTQGLQTLIEHTQLETLEQKQSALAGIGRYTNFYLVYHDQNDLPLQCQYGDLVHRIMAANYPHWVTPLPKPTLKAGEKIRLGYSSAFLHSYSGTLWLTGWLRHGDRQNFEIYCYYTGNSPDGVTEQFRQFCDGFHHIPHDLEAVCQQILADQLHVLMFPEIGMDPQTMQMAGLRLAPITCTAWGHPVTSGLPTVDYYFSSDLMEAPGGEAHYREQLVRLPHIGVTYPQPAIPPLTKTRTELQLREDAIVYLCCQAPFKYLPQHDRLWIDIAHQVPQAQFVFLRAGLIQNRVEQAFAEAGLHAADWCVFLPSLARNDYLMLNLLSDVYLDSIGFSGGNTTLDAIACSLPVVTLPSQFMRGHLSAGMLQRIGLTQTIARSEAHYVELAVELGLNQEKRLKLRKEMAEKSSVLYDDRDCLTAFEAFLKSLLQTL